MLIEFDPAKNERNIRERGLSFHRAAEFDFGTAGIEFVWRGSELRRVATGYLHGRLHVLVYVRAGDAMRVISLRKANEREVKTYEGSRRDLEQRGGVDRQ